MKRSGTEVNVDQWETSETIDKKVVRDEGTQV